MNALTKPRGAIIFLHGTGDSGPGIESWVKHVSPAFFPALQAAGIQTIFPSAPTRPYSMAGGQPVPVWFDRWSMGPSAKEDAAGLAETGKTVRGIVNQMKELGISDGRIVIGGFSMGGSASLYTTLAAPQDPTDASLLGIAGVFSLSSWVTSESTMWTSLDQQQETCAASGAPRIAPPAFLAHGSADPMISPAWGDHPRQLTSTWIGGGVGA
jgi:phospholipase/carboxylesterase